MEPSAFRHPRSTDAVNDLSLHRLYRHKRLNVAVWRFVLHAETNRSKLPVVVLQRISDSYVQVLPKTEFDAEYEEAQ